MRKEKPLLPWKVGGWIITRKTLILKGGWVGTLHKNQVGNRAVWQKNGIQQAFLLVRTAGVLIQQSFF